MTVEVGAPSEAFIYDDSPGWEWVEPEWALAAASERSAADLATAASVAFGPGGAEAIAGVIALETQDPAELARTGRADVILDGITTAARIVARLQAVQQRWLEAYSRPGVAVPLRDVVRAVEAEIGDGLLTGPGAIGIGGSGADGMDTALGVPADDPVPDSLRTGPDAALAARALGHPVFGDTVRETAAAFAAAEVACALHLAPITARTRTAHARHAVRRLPATLAAQEAGLLDGYRASLIAERLADRNHEVCAAVEERVLGQAADCTAAELRRLVDAAALDVDPAFTRDRSARARTDRHTSARSIGDGMGLFQALLPAEDALLVDGVLTTIATTLAGSELADGRGSGQLRADAFTDLFRSLAETGHACLGSTASGCKGARPGGSVADEADRTAGGSRQAHGDACRAGAHPELRRPVALNVYLDFATLAGLADHPGDTDGFGTVTAETARALAASAESVRSILVRPLPGQMQGAPPGRPPDEPPYEPLRTSARYRHESARGPGQGPGRSETIPWNWGAAQESGTEVHSDRLSPGMHSADPLRSRVCGTVVDPGRAVYRPPVATADYVRARDRHCTFPGCRARANRCDIDHREPYHSGDVDAGGATCPCNLDLLCRAHHRLKTFTAWTASPDADGNLTWLSPHGQRYPTQPAHLTAPFGAPPY